jgi:hypothetical protein
MDFAEIRACLGLSKWQLMSTEITPLRRFHDTRLARWHYATFSNNNIGVNG